MNRTLAALFFTAFLAGAGPVFAEPIADGLFARLDGDYAAAAKYFNQAAEQGDAQGQDLLAQSYETGQGVAQNIARAAYWYGKAAEQGYAYAQLHLGELYEKGWGVAQDFFAKAAYLYEKAAEQGYAAGQYHLGVMHLNGYGVRKSRRKAIEWLREAADQGHEDSIRALKQLGVN